MRDFELFRMEPSETIGDIYTRFMDVINSLKALGKSFSNFELVNKILRSLPKSQDPKVMTIQEVKNLNYFQLEELIGSLMTYEMSCLTQNKPENNRPKNRKDLSDDSSDDDDDLELLTMKLKKFLKQESKNNNELKKKLLKKKRVLKATYIEYI